MLAFATVLPLHAHAASTLTISLSVKSVYCVKMAKHIAVHLNCLLTIRKSIKLASVRICWPGNLYIHTEP